MPSSKLGFRVTGGQLHLWTGSPCEGTTQVVVKIRGPESGETTLAIYTPTLEPGLTPGVEFEHLALDGPYPGFNVKDPLPPGFDWRNAEFIQIEVQGPPVARGLDRNFASIATEITEHSSEHPEDSYFFPDVGWLNPDEVAAKDGKEFLTVCTPDPAKEESKQAVVGVRVTDGALRFWTGSPCPFDSGVMLTFQPGQAETIMQKVEHSSEGVEYVSFGGPAPDPELTVTHPAPHDFDWRTAKTVLFRLIETRPENRNSRQIVWSKATELAAPITESAQHPADTYYFEGHGWLNPADVAARDGTSMQTICGR
ncbi:hypothetical protein BVU76_17395 [Mycolicibacterium porcinum]|nr:hypothetical protein BVU76_17395 [Mycolicibacterium porcinum]